MAVLLSQVQAELDEAELELIQEVGSGAFGLVYEAREKTLKRTVAVKILHRWASIDSDSGVRERFSREAKVLSSLVHPNLLRIFRLSISRNSRPYMVLEYLQGQTLADRLKVVGRLTIKEALDYAVQISGAMAFVEKSGIVHRDLKPENIMITKSDADELIKILDFGLCHIIDPLLNSVDFRTRTGILLGTPSYMSPEQCLGKKVDSRSDIYAFACILYELLLGEILFFGSSPPELIRKQVFDTPKFPLLKLTPETQELDSFLASMLEKNPEKRPQSFSELNAYLIEMSKRAARTPGACASKLQKKKTSPRTPVVLGVLAASGLAIFTIHKLDSSGLIEIVHTSFKELEFESGMQRVKRLIDTGDTAKAREAIQAALGSKSFAELNRFAQKQILSRYLDLTKTASMTQEVNLLQIKLLELLFFDLHDQIAEDKLPESYPVEPIESLAKDLSHAKLERRQWQKISRVLESKWSLPFDGFSQRLAWLWVLRCQSLRLKDSTVKDPSSVAKYYFHASVLLDAKEPQEMLVTAETGAKMALDYKCYNRALNLRVFLAQYYLRNGQLAKAKQELALAQEYAAFGSLSGAEQEQLESVVEGCLQGKFISASRPGKKAGDGRKTNFSEIFKVK